MISCQTATVSEIAKFARRPNAEKPCIANGDGTCFRDGVRINTTNMICGEAENFGDIQEHLELMEYYYYRCKKYKRCN